MPRTLRSLALVLAALAAPGAVPRSDDGGTATAPDGGVPGPTYRVITGTIAKVDRDKARIEIDDGGRPMEISYDRNTSVFLEQRLGTVRDVQPGTRARAAVDGGGLAAWIELRGPPGSPAGSRAP